MLVKESYNADNAIACVHVGIEIYIKAGIIICMQLQFKGELIATLCSYSSFFFNAKNSHQILEF